MGREQENCSLLPTNVLLGYAVLTRLPIPVPIGRGWRGTDPWENETVLQKGAQLVPR